MRTRGAEHVGLLGYSAGAIAAILATAADPGVEAVVADSALTDLHQYLKREAASRSHLGAAYADYALVWYRWFTQSDERTVSPVAAVSRLAPRPLLLVHGLADRVIPPSESEALLAAAGNPRAELWLVPGGRHTHSYEADPESYMARVAGFLDAAVGR
jgi:dipeptidyl aminopeptidase/acylaminoacyl peptidase